MRLESALYASRSGIETHGQAISVVGDNISNASTTGFKAQRTEFSDLFSEGAEGRSSIAGPSSGNGVKLGSVRSIFDAGVIEPTGRELDVAIDGKGFFVVGDPASPQYTRAGSLSVDDDGLLVTEGGAPILGYQGTTTTVGTLNLTDVKVTGAATTQSSLFTNLDSRDKVVTQVPANPATFAEINNAANFSASYEVYDSLGTNHNVTVYYFKTAPSKWTAQAYIDSGDTGGTPGTPVKLGNDATLTFNDQGSIDAANAAQASITATPAWGGGAAAGNFTIGLDKATQFGAASQMVSVSQNGEGTGQIKGFEVLKDGSLNAVLDSGDRTKIGTILLASFANVDGLRREGNGLYTTTQTSGNATLAAPGTGINGSLVGNALERSTVDISTQFIDLILYQRAYEANSQTLSTTNEMIRQTIQLMR